MKSNKERARYILEISELRLKQKRVKHKKIEKCLAGAFCVCAVLVLSVTFLNTNLMKPLPDTSIVEIPVDTTENGGSEPLIPPTEEITSMAENVTEHSSDNRTTTCQNTQPTSTADVTDHVQQPIISTVPISQPEIQTTITISEQTTDIPQITTTVDPNDKTEQPSNDPPLPWDEMTINQQYFLCDHNGNEYQTEKQEISAECIGDKIGIGWMSGWDYYTDTYYHCDAEVFSIIEKATDGYIAVRFVGDEKFYIYKNCALFTNDSILDMTG